MQEFVAPLLCLHACELLACIQHSGLSVMGNERIRSGGDTGTGSGGVEGDWQWGGG